MCVCDIAEGVQPRDVCAPTTVVGPAGAWQALTVLETFTTQIPAQVETVERTFAPDGSVTIHREDSLGEPSDLMAELSPQDLTRLLDLVDGPLLRTQLRDVGECEPEEGYEAHLALVLDSATLEKDVGGCSKSNVSHPESFVHLMDLVREY